MSPVQRAHVVTQSPFLTFSRSEWARHRGATPMTLSQNDIDEIKGVNDALSLGEVIDWATPFVSLGFPA